MNVVLALSYTFYWRGNGITAITVTRRIANITVSPGGEAQKCRFNKKNITVVMMLFFLCLFVSVVLLTSRYSAVFLLYLYGNDTVQPNSGNPGQSNMFYNTSCFAL